MSLLAYCIAEANSTTEIPNGGVQGATLRTVTDSGLICFLSDYHPSSTPNHIRQSALEFNRVLQDLLRQVAIIPFRFPTLLADESELRMFLQQHATEYRNALVRLRDLVQIEVSLTLKDHETGEASGRAYLLARQNSHQTLARAAERVHNAMGTVLRDWREHPSSKIARCYMLVARPDLENAFTRVRELKIPPDLQA
ncbi:MAG: GvpL/GvpF family gas vesicle protein, partial [Acidobacteriaceae bacterium]|nr:GvpL/GvpF family gas vesicle protein [Acidobacteriaceae bacterium]